VDSGNADPLDIGEPGKADVDGQLIVQISNQKVNAIGCSGAQHLRFELREWPIVVKRNAGSWRKWIWRLGMIEKPEELHSLYFLGQTERHGERLALIAQDVKHAGAPADLIPARVGAVELHEQVAGKERRLHIAPSAALETPVSLERQENIKPQLLYFSTAFRLVAVFCEDDMPAHELSSFF